MYQYSAPVGSYTNGATVSGVEDIGGNAWEWINDWFSVQISSNSVTNWSGPETSPASVLKMIKRGSWAFTNENLFKEYADKWENYFNEPYYTLYKTKMIYDGLHRRFTYKSFFTLGK